MDDIFDAAVIGGGPGGLTAALYLARFKRSAIILDDGDSRARWIGKSHNYPTYVDGIAGLELLERLKRQALKYGVEFLNGRANGCAQENGIFAVFHEAGAIKARALIVAAGVKDVVPAIPGIENAIRQGRIGLCPVCHGYEAANLRVGVLAEGERGLGPTRFLKRIASAVSFLDASASGLSDGYRRELDCMEVEYVRVSCRDIEIEEAAICCRDGSGAVREFDSLYLSFGTRPNTKLMRSLGVALGEDGCLLTDRFQETSLRNVFGVGDIVRGLDQIVVAEGEAAIAASHLNLRWLEEVSSLG